MNKFSLILIVIFSSSCVNLTDTKTPVLPSVTTSPPIVTQTPLDPMVDSSYLSNEYQEKLKQVLLTNGECKLPCFLGIVPGEAEWVIANSLLKNLSGKLGVNAGYYEKNTLPMYGYSFTFIDSANRPIVASFDVTADDKVQRLLLYAETDNGNDMNEYYGHFSTYRIFSDLGIPDEVFIHVYMNDILNYPSYQLLILYKSSTAAFWLSGKSDQGKICPTIKANGEVDHLQISIANPDSGFDIFPPGWEFWANREKQDFTDTVDILGISSKDFYEQVIEDPTHCFVVK